MKLEEGEMYHLIGVGGAGMEPRHPRWLRGDIFGAAVEHVLRTLLLLRDGTDD